MGLFSKLFKKKPDRPWMSVLGPLTPGEEFNFTVTFPDGWTYSTKQWFTLEGKVRSAAALGGSSAQVVAHDEFSRIEIWASDEHDLALGASTATETIPIWVPPTVFFNRIVDPGYDPTFGLHLRPKPQKVAIEPLPIHQAVAKALTGVDAPPRSIQVRKSGNREAPAMLVARCGIERPLAEDLKGSVAHVQHLLVSIVPTTATTATLDVIVVARKVGHGSFGLASILDVVATMNADEWAPALRQRIIDESKNAELGESMLSLENLASWFTT